VIQAKDGSIHVTYSYFVNLPEGQRKSIKHARFNAAWIEEGDKP
jgi:predicted neuraminidase